MHAYYFAGYRLLAEDKISELPSLQYLSAFESEAPYTHTFSLRLGGQELLEEKYREALRCPEVCPAGQYTIYDTGSGWSILRVPDERALRNKRRSIIVCSRDYGEMTVYGEATDREGRLRIPFYGAVRIACEAGLTLREGLPLHASLVEKEGTGVLFLGPSGMGKSTQAKLWERYLGADFIIGDRPALRCLDGVWYAYGMPWDGKDAIKKPKKVPVRALVMLEQAKENAIVPLTVPEALKALLFQVMLPMWDERAAGAATALMGRLAPAVPFYRLRNRADEEAAEMTYKTVFSGVQ